MRYIDIRELISCRKIPRKIENIYLCPKTPESEIEKRTRSVLNAFTSSTKQYLLFPNNIDNQHIKPVQKIIDNTNNIEVAYTGTTEVGDSIQGRPVIINTQGGNERPRKKN